MKIDSSTIQMGSYHSSQTTTTETNSTINRYYGNGFTTTGINSSTVKSSTTQLECSTSFFTSSKENGIERTDKNDITHSNTEVEDSTTKQQQNNNAIFAAQLFAMNNFTQNLDYEVKDDPEIVMLRQMLEVLNHGRNGKNSAPRHQKEMSFKGIGGNFSFDSSSFSFGQTGMTISRINQTIFKSDNSSANGIWTRQTVTSGFVAGEEHTAYCSKGSVVTDDGRQIDFNITLEMSHSFAAAYESISAEAEFVLTDPLVINLDTASADISDVSFYFDLNSDGVKEKISSLGSGSGFLALDKNGDGVINDGSELFGTKSGDGFADLAQYDEDGNGWIDESDSIFKSLSVWVNAGHDNARLISLSEAGVGTIFRGSQKTQAVLADENSFEGAQIAKTGIYLRENGSVGTVQHIDFKA